VKEKILYLLARPSYGEGLSLQSFEKEKEEIREGILMGPCGPWFLSSILF
jgi:hypothetical protein